MPSLLTKTALTGFALATFVVTKFVIRVISARLCLRHIPGPTSTSLLWGEEWNLYHDAPGSHYLEWHQQFGKVVKFRGACGVLSLSFIARNAAHIPLRQHQILSITDERAVAFIVGEDIYRFPKPDGVRMWFKKTLGESNYHRKPTPS